MHVPGLAATSNIRNEKKRSRHADIFRRSIVHGCCTLQDGVCKVSCRALSCRQHFVILSGPDSLGGQNRAISIAFRFEGRFGRTTFKNAVSPKGGGLENVLGFSFIQVGRGVTAVTG
jgi:hypothetical protein